MTSVRVAFLSTAHIHTKSFIENILNAQDGRSVVAVWDDFEDRGRRYAQKANSRFVPDLAAVLNDPSVDGFVICAENTRHLPLLRAALPVGKPVFCEKPLVTSEADLAEVRKLIAEFPQTPLFCGYFMPFQSSLLAAGALIEQGKMGKITRVRFRNAHHAAYGRWFDSADLAWFFDPELSGGGGFMDMGTHAIHALRTLFGPVTRVWARIANESGIYAGTDDYGIAHLEFASGIVGTVEAGWTQTGGVGGLEITGSEGALWSTPEGYVIGSPKDKPVPLATAAEKPNRVDRLVEIVRGNVPAAEWRADLEAIVDSVAIMAAAYRSAETGEWQPVR